MYNKIQREQTGSANGHRHQKSQTALVSALTLSSEQDPVDATFLQPFAMINWHHLQDQSVSSTKCNMVQTGHLRVPYSGLGDYLFNVDYYQHQPNICPGFANVSLQAFNAQGGRIGNPTRPPRA